MPADPSPGPAARGPRDRRALQLWLLGIVAFAVILLLIVQARFLLISLVIAAILFSLTSDAIGMIARLRVGQTRVANWLASTLAVFLIASVLLTLTGIVIGQINTVVVTTLSYTDRAQVAIAELFGWMGDDVQTAVLNAMRGIDVGAYLRSAAGQAGNLTSATVLVILFVGFMFVERAWFPTKLSRLFPDSGDAHQVEETMHMIMRRVNHYLLVKTAVSAVTGAMVYAVMLAFGLELAAAMAILTFVLNYLPNIGSIIATAIVALVAYVQLGDLPTMLAVFAAVGAIQFVNGNIIDPWLMGRALRLSSFGIILSLAFWGAVWGVPGMFLSVPIMVALMIVCSQFRALHPVAVLLSREGITTPLQDEPAQAPARSRDHAAQ